MYQKNDQDILRNVRPTATGPTVRLPDNRQIKCTAIGNLPITTMSSRAKQSYIMPDLHSSSLLSIGQLCDENYSAVFTKKHARSLTNTTTLHSLDNETIKMAYGTSTFSLQYSSLSHNYIRPLPLPTLSYDVTCLIPTSPLSLNREEICR